MLIIITTKLMLEIIITSNNKLVLVQCIYKQKIGSFGIKYNKPCAYPRNKERMTLLKQQLKHGAFSTFQQWLFTCTQLAVHVQRQDVFRKCYLI